VLNEAGINQILKYVLYIFQYKKIEYMRVNFKKTRNIELNIISGGQDPTAKIGNIHIVVAARDKAPFSVEANVVEEDTFLVLSEEPTVYEPMETPVHLMTRLIETRPEIPGTVLVRGAGPYKIMAIVHDVNQEPTWREQWVYQALRGAIRAAERKEVKKIAIDMLGCMHGRLNPSHFTTYLKEIINDSPPKTIRRIWLRPPKGLPEAEVARWLRKSPD
jgi:hypothetical protein